MRLLVAASCLVALVLAVVVYKLDRRGRDIASAYDGRLRALESALDIIGYSEIRDRVVVPCTAPGGTVVIVTLGQSNASNSGDVLYRPSGHVVNFNTHDGKCYDGRDPLLGTPGVGGNFATRLADILIARGDYQRVVLAPLAVDGTLVTQWAPGGDLHYRLPLALARMAGARIAPDFFLWHQGEAEAFKEPDDVQRYANNVRVVVETLRRGGSTAPFFVAQTSVCYGPPQEATRQAQRAAVSSEFGILPGPDTDVLGPEFRRDGCHFNEPGQTRQAELWAEAIAASRR